MGDVVKFGRKSEEEKYEEALLAQYKEIHKPKKSDPNQSVAFVVNREKAEKAKKIESLCHRLGILFGWEDEYVFEKKFFPAELTTIQIVLSVPDASIEEEETKTVFNEAISLSDWMSIGSYEGEISLVFYVKNVVQFKTIKK